MGSEHLFLMTQSLEASDSFTDPHKSSSTLPELAKCDGNPLTMTFPLSLCFSCSPVSLFLSFFLSLSLTHSLFLSLSWIKALDLTPPRVSFHAANIHVFCPTPSDPAASRKFMVQNRKPSCLLFSGPFRLVF